MTSFGNHFVVQFAEQVAIARQIAAVEQRDGELGIVGIVAVALGQRARGRTQLQPQVPQLLRKAPDGIFESLLRVAIAEEEQQIDIGIGKQPAAAKSSGGDQSEIRRA